MGTTTREIEERVKVVTRNSGRDKLDGRQSIVFVHEELRRGRTSEVLKREDEDGAGRGTSNGTR